MPPSECQPRSGVHLSLPIFHIMGAMLTNGSGPAWPIAATDGNAVFEHKGVFHVMHQSPSIADGRQRHLYSPYLAAWGHVSSSDLAHWHRLPEALTPGRHGTYDGHDGDCDGTISLPVQSGFDAPIMTFGPDCGRPLTTRNDAPRVAFARPSTNNTNDAGLVHWTKDPANPIDFGNSTPCSFSGRVWRSGRNASGATSAERPLAAAYSMICAINDEHNAWGRYTTSDPQLHGPWKLADPSFATWYGAGPRNGTAVGSISAPAFLPLRTVATPDDAQFQSALTPTHMINALGGRAYWLGTYDPHREKLSVVGEPHFVESTSSPASWFVAGLAESSGRVLHVGFANSRDGTRGAQDCHWQPGGRLCLMTLVRELGYNAVAGALVSNPVPELAKLRNGTLLSTTLRIPAGKTYKLPLPTGAGAEMDLELSITLPRLAPLAFTIDVLASPDASRGAARATRLAINISAPLANDSRRDLNVSLSASRGYAAGVVVTGMPAALTAAEAQRPLHVRVLVDRSIVEAFIGGGRVVATARDYPAAEEVAARVSTLAQSASLVVTQAAAWSMGCGWV